ncbi:Uncharacterised protein [uncultured archaeon]|nr:Uncharacterised protein [uncultured archaeon]
MNFAAIPLWAKLSGVGVAALGLLWLVKRTGGHLLPAPPVNPRLSVVQAALSQVGSNDSAKYWADVIPGTNMGKASWCGGFALWALHQAGLARNWFWQLGKRFLFQLPMTKSPQPGDIAYFNNYQHHAVVGAIIDPVTVQLINGNGTGGKVSVSTTPMHSVTAFYSIEPLLHA